MTKIRVANPGQQLRTLASVIASLIMMVFIWQVTLAQVQPSVAAILEVMQQELTVGDRVPITVSITHPLDSRVLFPTLNNDWGAFELLEAGMPATSTATDGSLITTRTLWVTLWAPGEYVTPEYSLSVLLADGEQVSVQANSVTLTVLSVLTADDQVLRDIKPQASLSLPWRWSWLVAALLLALVLVLALLYWQRRRPVTLPEAAPPPPDLRPAYQIALGELAHIAAQDLPTQHRFQEYYTLISDVMRRYLERGFRVPALDRTTGEIQRGLRDTPIGLASQQQLRCLLETADLVKFAKLTPALSPAAAALTEARELILSTAPLSADVEPGGGE